MKKAVREIIREVGDEQLGQILHKCIGPGGVKELAEAQTETEVDTLMRNFSKNI